MPVNFIEDEGPATTVHFIEDEAQPTEPAAVALKEPPQYEPETPPAPPQPASLGPSSRFQRLKAPFVQKQIAGELGYETPVSPMDIASTGFKFLSVPPQVAEPIRSVTEPAIGALPPVPAGIVEGVRETALNFPILAAPIAFGANIGKVMMGLFTGEFLFAFPEQKALFDKARASGDFRTASSIATQNLLNGAILGLGAAHSAYTTAKPKLEQMRQDRFELFKRATETQRAADVNARESFRPENVRQGNVRLEERPLPQEPGMVVPGSVPVSDVIPPAIVQANPEIMSMIERRNALQQGGRLPTSGQEFVSVAEKPAALLSAEERIALEKHPEPVRTKDRPTPEEGKALADVRTKLKDSLEQRDLQAAVDLIMTQRPEIQPKLVNDILGVGKGKVPLSAAETTIFNELWDQALQKTKTAPEKPVEQPAPPPIEEQAALREELSALQEEPQPTPAKEVTPDAQEVQRKEAVTQPQPSPAAKQPWEMTKDEWHDEHLDDVIQRRKLANRPESDKPRHPDDVHKYSVILALSEGKPVPSEVLADYPDLKPSTPPARGTETTTASPVAETPPTTPPSEAGGGVPEVLSQEAKDLIKAHGKNWEPAVGPGSGQSAKSFVDYASGREKPFASAENENYRAFVTPSRQMFVESKGVEGHPVLFGRWMDYWEPWMKEVHGITEADYLRMTEPQRAEIELGRQIDKWAPAEYADSFARTYFPKEWNAWWNAEWDANRSKPGYNGPKWKDQQKKWETFLASKGYTKKGNTFQRTTPEEGGPVQLTGTSFSKYSDALVSKDPATGKWRLTWFNEFSGTGELTPYGHKDYASRKAALSAAKRLNYVEKPAPTAQPIAPNDTQAGKNVPSGQSPGQESRNLPKQETGGEAVKAGGVVQETQVKPTAQETGGNATLGIVPPGARVLDAIIKRVADKRVWQKWMTAAGNLPKDVHQAWIRRTGEAGAEVREAVYRQRNLQKAVQEELGISKTQWASKQWGAVPRDLMQQMDAVLKGEADYSTLPTRIGERLRALREHVDDLSFRMLERGLVDRDLATIIGNNLGTYLTRSYRIFDNPKWTENIPIDARRNAVQFLARERSITEAQADTLLREMLADWQDAKSVLLRGAKLGSKDLTMFMKRKDIAPEIRAVMGEYKDPVVNYMRSITKMSKFIADQEFLNKVREQGMGRFLFEPGTEPAGFNSQIAAESSSVMSPLNGLRTTPEIKAAFEEFNRQHAPSTNMLVRGYFWLNALSKSSKTVGSLLTHMRNANQLFFHVMNGHWRLGSYGKAAKAQWSDIVGTDARWQEYYKDLIRHGLANESPLASELRDTIRDAVARDLPPEEFIPYGYGRMLKAGVYDAPMRAYRLPDEFGKSVGWENEKTVLRQAHPEWTDAQVKSEAAERVRNTYPTYSMVPKAIRDMRRVVAIGPFMSFASESFRTAYHSMRYAVQDMKSDNPVLQRAGAVRAAGILALITSGIAISDASKQLFGISKEQEDDVRRFLPPWAKNSQLVFTGEPKNGEYSYVNYSYQNPYSTLIDPFNALLANNEKQFDEKLLQAFVEYTRPFTSEQMLAASIADVARNKTSRGGEVYNEADTASQKFTKSIGHIAKAAIEPGSIGRLRTKIVPSLTDTQPDYGRKLSPGTEIGSELTGIRAEKLDIKSAIGSSIRRFGENERNAEKLFSANIARTGTVSPQELVDSYRTSQQQRYKLWQSLYLDIMAARRSGLNDRQIRTSVLNSPVSSSDWTRLVNGKYYPVLITKDMQLKARQYGRTIPINEINKIALEYRGKSLVP